MSKKSKKKEPKERKEYKRCKGQVSLLTLVVGSIMAAVIGGILIYGVFFPTVTSLNYNTTTSYSATNASAVTVAITNTTRSIEVSHYPNLNSTLSILYQNSTLTGNTPTDVYLNGVLVGVLATPTGATTVTLTNISSSIVGTGSKVYLTYINGTATYEPTVPNITITSASFTSYFTNFAVIPEAQQTSFNTMLLLVGVLLVIIVLAGFALIIRAIS